MMCFLKKHLSFPPNPPPVRLQRTVTLCWGNPSTMHTCCCTLPGSCSIVAQVDLTKSDHLSGVVHNQLTPLSWDYQGSVGFPVEVLLASHLHLPFNRSNNFGILLPSLMSLQAPGLHPMDMRFILEQGKGDHLFPPCQLFSFSAAPVLRIAGSEEYETLTRSTPWLPASTLSAAITPII